MNSPEALQISSQSILAGMSPEAQRGAAAAIVANAAATGKVISPAEAAKHVTQLVEMSRRPSIEFVRGGQRETLNLRRTVTALQEGLRYGNAPLRVGAAVVAGETHSALLFAHDAPAAMMGWPFFDQEMGDRLDVLHTALRVQGPQHETIQEQLVERFVLPEGTPEARQAAALAIAGLTRTAGNPI
jgi:hypothetical protein